MPLSRRSRIYISGPITRGDPIHNFHQAVSAQMELIQAGLAPLNPMLTMMMPGERMVRHHEWMEIDLPWVAVADAVLRLPGESEGADAEVAAAMDRGIPVLYSVDQVVGYIKGSTQ